MQGSSKFALACVLAAAPATAQAGETPLTGPAPDWVIPAPELPLAGGSQPASPTTLFDEQVLIDGNRSTGYFDTASTASSPEELTRLGTLQLNWQPAHGDLTLHRIEIQRGTERIDLMKNGSGFTVLRREAGLENQIIDGTLTAVRQIEGLRLGDILRMSFSISESDDLLGGKVQTGLFLIPKPTKINFGRARLVWPANQAVAWKSMLPSISAKPRSIEGNRKELVVDMPVPALAELPADVPMRFRPLPLVSATTFTGWEEVAAVMAPPYRTEGTIADGSDLAKTVDAIAAAHADPVERMAEVLRTVQSDVRYQLIALGTGNYKPQAPAHTWEIRYGDCKAKTLLLMAMLHRMGITAEPVLANSKQGDLVPELLPAAQAFDHVFVRAEVAGESFWLDGTGLGSRLADIRDVPRLGHVLPLRSKGAALLKLPSRANARPSTTIDLDYDATAGPHLPVPFVLKLRYAGAWAEQLRINESSSEERLFELAENTAKTWTGSTTITKPTASYDPVEASWTLQVEGVGYPEWEYSEGRLELGVKPTIRVAFEPDRSRSAWQNLPAMIDKPWTAHAKFTLRLPEEAKAATLEGEEPIRLDLPAVSYERTVTREGATIVEQVVSRESGVEVPPADISATRRAISDAAAKVLRIRLPADYPRRWDDVAARRGASAIARLRALFDKRIAEKPEEAVRLADRGWLATRMLDWSAAEADYGKALALDPSSNRFLQRAAIRVARNDYAGALKDAQAAYDLDSGGKNARSQLAQVLSELGKTDQALDLLDKLPDIASEEGESALLERAEIVLKSGRPDEAIALLDSALAKRQSSPTLLNGRCWFKSLANTDLPGALSDCTRAIELSGQPAASFDSRAMVHYRAGRMDEALRDLNAALAIIPEQAASLFMRGIISERTGNLAGGRTDIAAARRLNPSIDRFFGHFGIKP